MPDLARRVEDGVLCLTLDRPETRNALTDELSAVRHVMARANPGDIVVVCVDQHGVVMNELETMTKQAQPGTRTADSLADPDLDPTTLSAEAQVSGEEATDQDLADHDLGEVDPEAAHAGSTTQ